MPQEWYLTIAAAVFMGRDREAGPFARLAPFLADCDLVLIEGWLDGPGPKLEVWRAGLGQAPLAAERAEIVAVVTEDPIALENAETWPRKDVRSLADRVLALARAAP